MAYEEVPGWEEYPDGMGMQAQDMDEYWTRFTKPTLETANKNQKNVNLLDARVSALEHSTPVGPGGKGA